MGPSSFLRISHLLIGAAGKPHPRRTAPHRTAPHPLPSHARCRRVEPCGRAAAGALGPRPPCGFFDGFFRPWPWSTPTQASSTNDLHYPCLPFAGNAPLIRRLSLFSAPSPGVSARPLAPGPVCTRPRREQLAGSMQFSGPTLPPAPSAACATPSHAV